MKKNVFERIADKACSLVVACLFVSCLQPLLAKVCNKYFYISIDNRLIAYIKNDIFNYLLIDKENSILEIFFSVFLFVGIYIICLNSLRKVSLKDYVVLKNRSIIKFDSVNVIKSLGAILVMLIHCCFEIGFYESNVNTPLMFLLIFIYNILLSCVPIFFSMTGYLSIYKPLNLKHYIGWFKYYIPYVLINLFVFFYYIVTKIIVNSVQFPSSLLQSFSVYLNGYMSCFFGLYILAPFLNKLWGSLDGYNKIGLLFALLILTIIPSVTGMMFTRFWTGIGVLLGHFSESIGFNLRTISCVYH